MMKRVVILIVATIVALEFTALQEVYISQAAYTPNIPTPTPTVLIGSSALEISPNNPRFPGYPYALVLTLQDSGGVFTVPINSTIYVSIPRAMFYQISYNPSILRLVDNYPYPIPVPVDPPIMPQMPDFTPMPRTQPDIAPYGWQLVAVGYGTTSLTLAERPCYDKVCPKHLVFNFSVTINVQDAINPPPIPPQLYPRPTDVYIGTAYLNQTVKVHIGQIVALDLPFISTTEPVLVSTNNAILNPLPGTDLTRVQAGGWRFSVVQGGTTTINVQTRRCMNIGSTCTPALLFTVTISAS